MKMRSFIIILIIITFSCEKKPTNLLNRIGGDAHLIESNSIEFKDSIAIVNYLEGIDYLKKANLTKAKKSFLKSYEIEPNNTSIINTLGSIEADLGNFKKSYEYFENSLEKNKWNTLTYMSYGVALNKSIYQNKAIEIWKKGLIIEKNYEKTGYFYYNIANALHKKKRFKEAKIYNDIALKIVEDKEVRKDIIELDEFLKNKLK